MIAHAALIGIDFKTGEILKQIFSTMTGEENPINACEMIRSKMEPMFENFTFTIVANDDARTIYANQIESKYKK